MSIPTLPGTLFFAGLVALVVVIGLVARPRLMWLLLLPAITAFAWVKRLVAIPTNINKALLYFVMEKDNASIEHLANVGAVLWAAGFRESAEEIFVSVAAARGITLGDRGETDGRRPFNGLAVADQDPYDAAKVAAAAEAVQIGVPIGGKVAKS